MNQQIPPKVHLFLIHHAYLQQHIQPENQITVNIPMPIFLERDQQISDFQNQDLLTHRLWIRKTMENRSSAPFASK